MRDGFPITQSINIMFIIKCVNAYVYVDGGVSLPSQLITVVCITPETAGREAWDCVCGGSRGREE